MVIILILWQIKCGEEETFIKAWKEDFVVDNRDKLIGEFLSKPVDDVKDVYKNWTVASFGDPVEDVTTYVNVGMWDSLESFIEEIERYIPEPGTPLPPFQVARYRVILEPVAWRIGSTKLPESDSDGTF
ncbi:MAG: hypothetical protein WDZ54_11080 [Sneathiella sp.]